MSKQFKLGAVMGMNVTTIGWGLMTVIRDVPEWQRTGTIVCMMLCLVSAVLITFEELK